MDELTDRLTEIKLVVNRITFTAVINMLLL